MVRGSEFPEESELVICTVKNVKNFGAFVSLDEYDGKEGFIHIRDVATGWVKYIRDYVREGQKIVCKVLGVDSSKGHIDLSLKSVNDHQKREKIQQWKNENKAERLLGIVAERIEKTLDECYEEFALDLIEDFGTLYGAFELCAGNPEILDEEGYEGDWKTAFIEVAEENVTPPYVQIDGYLELTCPASNGVEILRNALIAGIDQSEEEVSIQYIGAPRYRLVINAPDYKIAEEELKVITNRIISEVQNGGGEASFHRESK
ncbi:MAG: translation initiation factor IF-2 subunit alpha [Methanomassiliicoccales archaeon]|nr:translation initiation factor IF-2 subunit alpha [Methanomassiliicoccales archaeon]NYT16077.1 translation initiation factor IF-2 subunit alpha [Methanomassiliicoccales archaeon]